MSSQTFQLPTLAEMHRDLAVKFQASADRWRVIAKEAIEAGDLKTAIYAGNNVQEREEWSLQERRAAVRAQQRGF